METAEKYLALRSLIQKTEGRALVYGVTISEYLMLRQVVTAGHEGISRMDLAERSGLSVLELTKALQPLEKLCFIETMDATPNPRERRIAMTPGGSGIFGDIEHEFLRRMNLMTFEIDKLLNRLL
jgi:DNA-binding MarR family transcriptional regulator